MFGRDEQMLVGWALNLAHRDFKMVLDTWRVHADPDREERTAEDRFDSRKLHLSQLLDGMGRLDGLLDPESMLVVSEAIRSLAGEPATTTSARPSNVEPMRWSRWPRPSWPPLSRHRARSATDRRSSRRVSNAVGLKNMKFR